MKNESLCILMTSKLECKWLEQSKLTCECHEWFEHCPSVVVLEEYNGSSAQVPVICAVTCYSVFDNVGISTLFF